MALAAIYKSRKNQIAEGDTFLHAPILRTPMHILLGQIRYHHKMGILRNLSGALSSYQRHLNEVLQMIASSDSLPLLTEYSRDGSGYVRQAVLARCVELARP